MSTILLPTGILELDHLGSTGGIPRGALTILLGQSPLRTFLALRVLENVISQGGTACWVDWKGELTLDHLESLELDVSKVTHFAPSDFNSSVECAALAFRQGADLIVFNGTNVIPPQSKGEMATSSRFWTMLLPHVRKQEIWDPNALLGEASWLLHVDLDWKADVK